MSKAKVNFIVMAIFAFVSVIAFFQINSYWADTHNFNGFFGWLGIGILFAGLAVYFLIKVLKTSNSETDYSDRK